MSHLPERGLLRVPLSSTPVVTKKNFNISRSFQKFLRFVFKSSNSSNKSMVCNSSNSISFQVPVKYSKERVYVVYDKSGPFLSTIPELPELEIGAAISPDKFKPTTIEEYIDYLFPDETQTTNLKILEAAYKWKKQKLSSGF
ncbi:hypothetical protein TanjilG_22916 [Lupinus angustifolius]|uniref:Uncharacterized protein n=1 Tax=Lupinus angustifolius TaxID=3871 RepID=A0A1J7IAE3_LUPAN|nr:hypothetical protein TanjilG_22916 [Lupinus angustifolius]